MLSLMGVLTISTTQGAQRPESDRNTTQGVEAETLKSSDEGETSKETNRGLIDLNNVFVPKGQWSVGGSLSYSSHTNEDYQVLVVNNINSEGYSFKVSPMVTYNYANNLAVGARFIYSRSMLNVDSADLSFGDTDDSGIAISANNYNTISHSYLAMAILRQYIPLGQGKRFALFNEVQFGAGGSQSKYTFDSPVKGTYSTSLDLSLGLSPGVIAFATNNIAVEVSVGMLGLSYSHTKQIHNQVETGDVKSGAMNFKLNLFSIGFGVSFYL